MDFQSHDIERVYGGGGSWMLLFSRRSLNIVLYSKLMAAKLLGIQALMQ